MSTCDLVLPCRDEAPALAELLPRVPAAFSVLVVDNGSTDDTAAVARSPRGQGGHRVDTRVRRGGARRAARRRPTTTSPSWTATAPSTRPSCCRCWRTCVTGAPTSPSDAAARSRAASGPGTPGSATPWSSPGCGGGSGMHGPRHRPDARRPPRRPARPGRAGPAVRLSRGAAAEGHPRGLAGGRARRRLPPARRGHPLQGVRLGPRHGPRGPRLLEGARPDARPRRRQGARRRPGQDPARRRHRRPRRRRRRGRGARSTRSWRPATGRRTGATATSRSPATSPTPSTASGSATWSGLDGHDPARRRLRRAPGQRPCRRRPRATSSRSAWTPRRSPRTCSPQAARRARRPRRRARAGRRRRLVGARPVATRRRCGARTAYAMSTADDVRRHPGRAGGDRGVAVATLPGLCDVDTAATPTRWPRLAPHTEFARAWAAVGCAMTVDRSRSPAARPAPRGLGPARPTPTTCAAPAALRRADPRHRLRSRAGSPPRSPSCGHVVLGIDVVHEAVGQTRGRGGAALHRDVFERAAGRGPLAHRPARRRQRRHRRRPGRAAAPAPRAARPARPGRRRGRRPAPASGPAGPRLERGDRRRRRSAGRSSASTPSTRSLPGRAGRRRVACRSASAGAPCSRSRVKRRPCPSRGLPLPPAQPGGRRPGRPVARHLLRHLLPHRPDQPLRPEPVPADPVPDQPVVGLPGHPGTARASPAPPRSRCCWSSCGRSTPGSSPARRATSASWSSTVLERASIAVLVAAAIFQLATGLAERRPVVPVGLLLPDHALRDGLGRDRRAARAHRGQAADHPRRAPRRRRRHASTTAPTRHRARRARPAAACCARPGWRPGSPCWPPRQHRCRCCARSRSSGCDSGDGPQGIPINKSAAAAGVTAAATRRATGSRSRTATAGPADPRDLRRDGAAHRGPADRLRRGLERQRRPGPASGCATCSTWSAPRAGRDVLVVSLQERGPFRDDRAAGQLRRRRPHPARARRSTASRSRSTTATPPADRAEPSRGAADQVGHPAGGAST